MQKNKLPDIEQKIVLNASIEKVWEAVATSDGIAAWFMPNDFKPVEGYEFHLNAGNFGMSPCKVTEIDRPNRLSFNWGKDWTLTFLLEETGNKTKFTIIHSGWEAGMLTEFGETHEIVRERMNHGWAKLKNKLAEVVKA
jgi:uncharacterized protein YndB with AHSA1/START domain